MLGRRFTAVRDRVLTRVDQPAACPLNWVPSVFTPVFHGYRDHVLSLAEPRVVAMPALGSSSVEPVAGSIEVTCRVFYPSLDGSPHNAPPLTGCSRTSLICFSHGQCDPGNVPDDFYLAWYELPATLARAGYVVLVPQYEDFGADSDEDLERLVRLLRWARSPDSPYVDMLRTDLSTGLVGHSYGAALAARAISESRVEVGAFAALSPNGGGAVLNSPPMPVLQTWGGDEIPPTGAVLDSWRPNVPAHAVQFNQGLHHDYLPRCRASCTEAQGMHSGPPCTPEIPLGAYYSLKLMPYLAADIVALFMGRYLPQHQGRSGCILPVSSRRVPITPEPASWHRSTEQSFYAGGWFSAWPVLDTGDFAGVELHYWDDRSWHNVVRGD